MSDEFDADAFRAEATGDATPETTSTTDAHAVAEGTEPSDDVGSTSTLRDMLLSTDPDRSLDTFESPWDPDRGGPARIYRGLMKATDVDGMPAVVDLIIGAAEIAHGFDPDDVEPDHDDQDADQEADLLS
jgi:hypothetical protein